MMPKVIVSTMIANSLPAFRNHKDITYIQSPCDFGSLNELSKAVLSNAAKALTAMDGVLPRVGRTSVAITAIGLTDVYTKEVKAFWREKNFNLVPFHAAGESTMAMAELMRTTDLFAGVLDLTLHDVIDFVAGGTTARSTGRGCALICRMTSRRCSRRARSMQWHVCRRQA